MNFSNCLVFSTVVLSLSAGGGGGDEPPAPASVPSFTATSLTEYMGLWKRDAASDRCLPACPHNPAYCYRLRDISVVIQNNNLDATIAVIAYGDAGCAAKQGRVTKTFALNTQSATLAGRSNAVKGKPVMFASTIGVDGDLDSTDQNARRDGK